MISNRERQQKLDVEKWLLSEKLGCDKAGDMDWCAYCKSNNNNKCGFVDNGKNEFPCARAYNKKERSKKVNLK